MQVYRDAGLHVGGAAPEEPVVVLRRRKRRVVGAHDLFKAFFEFVRFQRVGFELAVGVYLDGVVVAGEDDRAVCGALFKRQDDGTPEEVAAALHSA